jgi:ectoine hydroxylase-related dioxygenase (phytanoyl-CoA dioxygenase family)
MTDTTWIHGEIEERGYCVVEGVLTPSKCDRLIDACRTAHARFSPLLAHAESTAAVHGEGNVALVHNLHNKGEIFLDLIFHPVVDAVANTLLSKGSYQGREPFQLALSQARGLTGPHPAQQLHIDSYLPGLPYVLVLQAAWILSDFAPGSGATRLIPESQHLRQFAENGVDYDGVAIEAARGSLVLFDGGMWHGSSEKTTVDERWAIFNRYSRWFMRPSFDITRNTPRAIFDKLDDHQRQVLGFRYNQPIDEFTRVTRLSDEAEFLQDYELPRDASERD